jgi:hypothetical protein
MSGESGKRKFSLGNVENHYVLIKLHLQKTRGVRSGLLRGLIIGLLFEVHLSENQEFRVRRTFQLNGVGAPPVGKQLQFTFLFLRLHCGKANSSNIVR